MARYWDTADRPTNANLNYLESFARHWPDVTPDRFTSKSNGVSHVMKMLPAAVTRHLHIPWLVTGSSQYDWDPVSLVQRDLELSDALNLGLADVHADPSLKRGGGADWSDRPATRGEQIEVSLEAYRERRGCAELSDVRLACGWFLTREIERLDKWLTRKRPSSGGRSIEYEIADVLGDISRRASDLHHEAASPSFAGARRPMSDA